MVFVRQVQSILLSCLLAFPVFPQTTSQTTTASAAPTADELQQLVAPIALYPDALVAQVLAASTYPTQIVEADRWVSQNSGLKGEQLGSAIDKQSWDPSVKALAQFPSVLTNMSQNLSWTSALGDAYFNDPQGVMNAIQALRKDAQSAGNLQSTTQQNVTTQGDTIIIQPAEPDVVYVPTYGPEIYGGYVTAYPGYSGWDVAAASAISFGVGTLVGASFGGWGWGWNHWGTNWHGGNVTFNRNTFVSRSNTFVNRNSAYNQFNRRTNLNQGQFRRNNTAINRNAEINRGAVNKLPANRPGSVQNFKPSTNQFQNRAATRGFGQSNMSSMGSRRGAFGGFSQGGSAGMSSSRGRSSFGGGGRGGGGFRGGGGRGGRR